MDYIKIRFGEAVEPGRKGDNRPFDEMFHSVNPMFCMARSIWKPQVDISETPSMVVLQASLAGVAKEDMEVEISSNAVKVTGKRRGSEPTDVRTFLQAEIRFGSFERLLYLPCLVETETVEASFNDGFLTLHLTKSRAVDH